MTTGITKRRFCILRKHEELCAMRSMPFTTVLILLCVTIAALA
jgi:hypothetical protein